MEWLIVDDISLKTRRKYSNETMRKLKTYIDVRKLKSTIEGYNEVLDRLEEINLKDSRLRENEEIIKDREIRSI